MSDQNKTAVDPEVARLQKQVADLETKNKELQQAAADGVPADIAHDVGWRQAAGLTRDQAIAAAKAQKEWDNSPEGKKAAKAAK